MTPYEVATMALGVFVAGLGWWNKVLWGEIKSIKDDMKNLPDTYARRDDLHNVEQRILDAISDLSKRIDRFLNKSD